MIRIGDRHMDTDKITKVFNFNSIKILLIGLMVISFFGMRVQTD